MPIRESVLAHIKSKFPSLTCNWPQVAALERTYRRINGDTLSLAHVTLDVPGALMAHVCLQREPQLVKLNLHNTAPTVCRPARPLLEGLEGLLVRGVVSWLSPVHFSAEHACSSFLHLRAAAQNRTDKEAQISNQSPTKLEVEVF